MESQYTPVPKVVQFMAPNSVLAQMLLPGRLRVLQEDLEREIRAIRHAGDTQREMSLTEMNGCITALIVSLEDVAHETQREVYEHEMGQEGDDDDPTRLHLVGGPGPGSGGSGEPPPIPRS